MRAADSVALRRSLSAPLELIPGPKTSNSAARPARLVQMASSRFCRDDTFREV